MPRVIRGASSTFTALPNLPLKQHWSKISLPDTEKEAVNESASTKQSQQPTHRDPFAFDFEPHFQPLAPKSQPITNSNNHVNLDRSTSDVVTKIITSAPTQTNSMDDLATPSTPMPTLIEFIDLNSHDRVDSLASSPSTSCTQPLSQLSSDSLSEPSTPVVLESESSATTSTLPKTNHKLNASALSWKLQQETVIEEKSVAEDIDVIMTDAPVTLTESSEPVVEKTVQSSQMIDSEMKSEAILTPPPAIVKDSDMNESKLTTMESSSIDQPPRAFVTPTHSPSLKPMTTPSTSRNSTPIRGASCLMPTTQHTDSVVSVSVTLRNPSVVSSQLIRPSTTSVPISSLWLLASPKQTQIPTTLSAATKTSPLCPEPQTRREVSPHRPSPPSSLNQSACKRITPPKYPPVAPSVRHQSIASLVPSPPSTPRPQSLVAPPPQQQAVSKTTAAEPVESKRQPGRPTQKQTKTTTTKTLAASTITIPSTTTTTASSSLVNLRPPSPSMRPFDYFWAHDQVLRSLKKRNVRGLTDTRQTTTPAPAFLWPNKKRSYRHFYDSQESEVEETTQSSTSPTTSSSSSSNLTTKRVQTVPTTTSVAVDHPKIDVYCFHCEEAFFEDEQWMICNTCYQFKAHTRCFDKVKRMDRTQLEEHQKYLLERDLKRPAEERHFKRLEQHQFTIKHADWTVRPKSKKFGFGKVDWSWFQESEDDVTSSRERETEAPVSTVATTSVSPTNQPPNKRPKLSDLNDTITDVSTSHIQTRSDLKQYLSDQKRTIEQLEDVTQLRRYSLDLLQELEKHIEIDE